MYVFQISDVVASIFLVVIFTIAGLPMIIFYWDISNDLIGRIVTMSVYLFLMLHLYVIKKYKKINLITTLSYVKNFDTEKYGDDYLTYLFHSSLILFLPVLSFSMFLPYLKIETPFDFWLLFGFLFV
ncbi:MAG: hypothetical protein ACRCST_16230 [Turicibacter sp.]